MSDEPEALATVVAPAGAGLTLAHRHRSRDALARDGPVAAVEERSTPSPGFYVDHPQRRRASPALRAFVDHVRGPRNGGVPES